MEFSPQAVVPFNRFSLRAELHVISPTRRLNSEINTNGTPRRYSYLKASIGSSLDALNAG
jgi:hypothetical protein